MSGDADGEEGGAVDVAGLAAEYDMDDNDNEADDGYTGPQPRSALFENYYRQQDMVPADEWEEWISALQRKLPVTFRLSSINGLHRRLLAALQRDEFGIEALNLQLDGKTLPAPQPLTWYPDSMAWYLPVSKGTLGRPHLICAHPQHWPAARTDPILLVVSLLPLTEAV